MPKIEVYKLKTFHHRIIRTILRIPWKKIDTDGVISYPPMKRRMMSNGVKEIDIYICSTVVIKKVKVVGLLILPPCRVKSVMKRLEN